MNIAAILELITATARAAKGAVDLAKSLQSQSAPGGSSPGPTDEQIAAALAAAEAPAVRIEDRADAEIDAITKKEK